MEHLKIDVREIDALNLACYETIADEYDDLSHETCRDFDTATSFFIKEAIRHRVLEDLPSGLRYLDVGVGTGVTLNFMMEWLEKKHSIIEVLDISKKMLSITKAKYGNKISKFHHTSIHNFNPPCKYDLILAALCDPYLTEKSLNVLKESLTKNGVLMLTLPTHTWAKKIRKEDILMTFFRDKLGNRHGSFSFCWSKADLIKFNESYGLYNICSKVILVDEVKTAKTQISPLNTQLISHDKSFPMMLTMIFINRG